MLRLKANKTSLYELVSEFENLPPMRQTKFIKAYRAPDYWLKWTDSNNLWCEAFLSTCCGKCLLTIEKKEFDEQNISRMVHKIETKDMMKRNMVEEFTTNKQK